MSSTLTDANVAASDPADGLAALESRGSVAETFGIPLAVLAEKYAAERGAIATDVIAMLQDLADKGFLTEAREKTS